MRTMSISSSVLRLFQKAGHAAGVVDPHDAQAGGLVADRPAWRRSSRRPSAARCVASMSAKVHAVELVAGEDQHVLDARLLDVAEVLPHGVGGALVPVVPLSSVCWAARISTKPPLNAIEAVGLADVPVQADRVELREHVDAVQPLLMQFESGMSIRRYLPASGTAGFER